MRSARDTENHGVQTSSCAGANTADLLLLLQHIPHVSCDVPLGVDGLPSYTLVKAGAYGILQGIREDLYVDDVQSVVQRDTRPRSIKWQPD
jgi:hypothetical protein